MPTDKATGERLVLEAEIANRRAAALIAVVLSAAASGFALTALLSSGADFSTRATKQGLIVAIWAMLVGAGVLCFLIAQDKRCAHVRAALSFFKPRITVPSLVELANDPRLSRSVRDTVWFASTASIAAVGPVATFAAWLADSNHRWPPIVVLSVVAAVDLALWLELVAGRPARASRLAELAAGMDRLRTGETNEISSRWAKVVVFDASSGGVLRVSRTLQLPSPEYAARAYFGEGQYQRQSEDQTWVKFVAAPAAQAGLADDRSPVIPPPAPALARRGAVAAAFLIAVTSLLLALTISYGAPRKLPAWSLDSPLLYEAARAAAPLIILTLVANMLLAMAAGRLVRKVGRDGFELDPAATSAELQTLDRTTAETLASIGRRVLNLETLMTVSSPQTTEGTRQKS